MFDIPRGPDHVAVHQAAPPWLPVSTLVNHPAMRNAVLQLFLLCTITAGAQAYVPFPTDTAVWNGYYRWNGSPFPEDQYSITYRHVLGGDTVIDGTSYKKLLYNAGGPAWVYHGALREDAQRNIWILPPSSPIVVAEIPVLFPTDQEQLLYTFDNLSVGTVLDLGTTPGAITVTGMDSILVQGTYRKRYTLQNTNLLQPDHWIEGIGSTVDLLSPFLSEFEWAFYTRCFQAPGVAWENPDDQMTVDCDLVLSVPRTAPAGHLIAVPDPGSDVLALQGLPATARTIELIDAMGRLALRAPVQQGGWDVRALPAGVYSIRVLGITGPERMAGRWVKE